jgi:hypothetical protein
LILSASVLVLTLTFASTLYTMTAIATGLTETYEMKNAASIEGSVEASSHLKKLVDYKKCYGQFMLLRMSVPLTAF